MQIRKGVFLFGMIICILSMANAETVVGLVEEVMHGDMIMVSMPGKEIKTHLYGVVCPEGKAPFGKEACFFTTKKALGKKVRIEIIKSSNNFVEGVVYLDSDTSLNSQLVETGLAKWDSKNAPHERVLVLMQRIAQVEKRGIWKSVKPISKK